MRSILAIALCALMGTISGCATVLVPEMTIKSIPPDDARDSLKTAVAYADQSARQFDSVKSDIGITEAGLSILTLGAATVIGYDVVFARAAQTLRAPALTVGFLQGVELTTAGVTKRQILDTGSLALVCAKRAAYAMDALGAASQTATVTGGNPSPIAPMAASMRGAIQSGGTTAQSLHQLADSLRAVTPVTNPQAPGTSAGSNASTNALADVVDNVANKQKAAADEAASQVDAAKSSAKDFLAMTVEMVVRETLQQLHASSPSLDKIAAVVRDNSQTYLASTKKAIADAATSTTASKQTAAAIAPIARVAVLSDLQGQLNVVVAQQTDGPPADVFDAKGKPLPRPPPRPVVAAAAQEAANSANAAQKTVSTASANVDTAASSDGSALATVSKLLDLATICGQ